MSSVEDAVVMAMSDSAEPRLDHFGSAFTVVLQEHSGHLERGFDELCMLEWRKPHIQAATVVASCSGRRRCTSPKDTCVHA